MSSEGDLAAPDSPELSQLEAWYMDDDTTADQRKPHRRSPNAPVSVAQLNALGVLTWRLDADAHATCPRLKAIRERRGYSYEDVINITRETLPDYDGKLKIFFTEHIHTDEEIRYVLDGSGFFDVRDREDQWIRIATCKGDLITLPEGIYHRFTLDEGDYIKAMRLFVGLPVWTPLNRGADLPEDHPSRTKYTAGTLAGGGGGIGAA